MTPEVLLSVLKDFGEEDFKDFKWHLQRDGSLEGHPAIPKNKLEKAERRDTVDLMIQTYTLPGAVEATKQLLKKINRNDLVQRLCDSSSGPAVCNSAGGSSSSHPPHPPHPPTDRKTGAEASGNPELLLCNSAGGSSSSHPPTDRKTDAEASELSAFNTNSFLRELDLSKDPHWGLDPLRVEHGGEQRLKPGLRKYACELTLDTNTEHRTSQVSHSKRKVTAVDQSSSSSLFDFCSKLLRRK